MSTLHTIANIILHKINRNGYINVLLTERICVCFLFCFVFLWLKGTNWLLGYILEVDENTHSSVSPPWMWYSFIQFLKWDPISSRMVPGMSVHSSCCLHGPLHHSLCLGPFRGSNRKHFITVVRLAGLSTHLWDSGMQTCQLIFNNDSSGTCLLLNDGKAA